MAEKEEILKTGYLTTHTGPDETVVDGDDLLEDVKDKIGDYLSKKTREAGNSPPITAGSTESSITTPDGLPAPIVSDGSGIEGSHASDAKLSRLGVDPLGAYSNSGKFETLGDLIKKGKQSGQGQDGNKLLLEMPSNGLKRDGSTIVVGGEDSPVIKQVSKLLKSANRFDPSNTTPFISVAGTQLASAQQELGRFDRNANVPSMSELQKVGLSLMIRATGEFIDGDPNDVGETAMLIPGAAQLAATRIDARGLYAQNAFGAPNKPTVNTDISVQKEGMFGDVSYGNLNSVYEPFGGFLPVGMTILGTALIIALKLVLELFGFLFEMILSTDNTTKSLPLPLGKNIASTNSSGFLSSIMSPATLGIRETKFPFALSFARGTDAFFSFDGESFNRILTAPGYYAITVRAVIRSGNTIANSLADIGGNPLDVAQGIMGLVDIIKSSKIIGLINILTGIGDNVLMLEESGFAEDATLISTIDAISSEKNPATHVFKSRIKSGQLALAWGNSTTKSKYIMPESIIKADFIFSNNRRKMLAVAGAIDAAPTSRLTPEDVASVETELDAEYVPFYFHDLRTNEIISFHAFLESLSDAFTPSYETSAGFGRIDPVRIYKNTERALTISFYVVATSENDFDNMWVKINKLITMLYPQWSSGRSLTNNKTKFTQPFSQTIGASPMIRLRIGDVVKSNYSRFALARLFGLGDDDFTLTGTSAFSQFDVGQLKEKIKKNIQDLVNPNDVNKGYPVNAATPMKVRLYPGTFRKGRPSALLGGGASMLGISGGDKSPAEYSPLLCEVVTIVRKEIEIFQRAIGMQGSGEVSTRLVYDVKVDKYPDVTYVVPYNYLQPINSEVLKYMEIGSDESGIDSAEADAIKNFFDDKEETGNSIVRSFKTTQGKGLAGFITNMSFDWISNVTWDTGRFGARAPKAFKVDFGFAPTHDIAPGLDADGFNRAPIYNVGSIMNDISGDVYDETGTSEANFELLQKKIEPKKGG